MVVVVKVEETYTTKRELNGCVKTLRMWVCTDLPYETPSLYVLCKQRPPLCFLYWIKPCIIATGNASL